MDTSSIDIRYSALAEQTCCLSCGGAIILPGPFREKIVLILAVAVGTDVLRMAEEVGEKGFVIGVDVSEGMLETARRNASKLGISNVSFIRSDLETLPVADGFADLVISNCTINHVTDKNKVWQEIYRILKSGGRFVVSDIYAVHRDPG